MKLGILSSDFNAMSQTKKKKYIAQLIIRASGAKSVLKEESAVALVMAGLPGAGKTEFLDTLADGVKSALHDAFFIRIDLDQIIEVYPDYTPKDYYKFRSQANVVLSACVDEAIHGHYNIMLDGTFSGPSGATVNTIGRLLENGYIVNMIYLYDAPERAWKYSCKRRDLTGRPIEKQGFIQSAGMLTHNIKAAIQRYSINVNFNIAVVMQKELRDKNYDIITSKPDIDNLLNQEYTINEELLID